jgi:putative ABC transport system substrate-binding protein
MKRLRAFITLLGGATTAWPFVARAQQPERVRRLGMLMNRAADDPRGQIELAAFQQALQQLGWSDGRNIRIDTRWGENNVDRDRGYAAELVALAPDLILASGTLSVAALRHATRTLPIVFVEVSDPVGAGLVDTLARPGGLPRSRRWGRSEWSWRARRGLQKSCFVSSPRSSRSARWQVFSVSKS